MRKDANGKIWKADYFQNVQVNEYFQCNGNTWRKRSTRTAVIASPERHAGTWFYFGKCEVVERHVTPAIA